MKFGLSVIRAFDIPDSYYKCINEILKYGYEWTIQKGSFEGHTRLEFDNVVITISNPSNRPLIPIDFPEGVPPPTDMNYVNLYMGYLITPDKKKDEQYTYGERITKMLPADKVEGEQICSQIDYIIKMLQDTPMTNQACMSVGKPEDVLLKDPPCLRLIDCRIRYGALHFFTYFRSWDLWTGFPNNLAGIQLMKEYMARQIGVEDGTLNAYSKGLHLYDFQIPLAKKLVKPRGRR